MKTSRKILLVGVVLLISCGLAIGALMNFYARETSKITSDVVLTWDTTNAENLILTEDFITVGGNTDTYSHTMVYSSEADNELTVDFTISNTSDDDSEGIVFTVYENSTGVWLELVSFNATADEEPQVGQYTFTPGETLELMTEYVCDTYLMQGDYEFTLDITRSV